MRIDEFMLVLRLCDKLVLNVYNLVFFIKKFYRLIIFLVVFEMNF